MRCAISDRAPSAVRHAFALVAVSAALVGCSSGQSLDSSVVEYTEPGWMAEVRAQNEEYTSAGMACLRGEGQEPFSQGASYGGSVASDENGDSLPGADEAMSAALAKCSEEVPPPEYVNNDLDMEYARLLELRACLINEGHDIPRAPSKEAWIDAGDLGRWTPYDVLLEVKNGKQATTREEQDRLQLICTPSAYGNFVNAG